MHHVVVHRTKQWISEELVIGDLKPATEVGSVVLMLGKRVLCYAYSESIFIVLLLTLNHPVLKIEWVAFLPPFFFQIFKVIIFLIHYVYLIVLLAFNFIQILEESIVIVLVVLFGVRITGTGPPSPLGVLNRPFPLNLAWILIKKQIRFFLYRQANFFFYVGKFYYILLFVKIYFYFWTLVIFFLSLI